MPEHDYLVQAEITRAAFEQGPDAMVVVSNAGVILAVNVQAELLTGRPRRDLLGQQVEMLIPENRRVIHHDHRATYMRSPYRRLMGPDLDLMVLQRTDSGEIEVSVDVNLAPVVISIGPVFVATIRQRGDRRWGDVHA